MNTRLNISSDRSKSRSQTKKGPGRMHSRVKEQRKDKVFAKENGIPPGLRKHAQHYGTDSFSIAQIQKQAKPR